MDPIFTILENAGNPTTQQHRSKWSQVQDDLKRSGRCVSCGASQTVQRTVLGIKPKSGHPCYKENMCIPCYNYERDRRPESPSAVDGKKQHYSLTAASLPAWVKRRIHHRGRVTYPFARNEEPIWPTADNFSDNKKDSVTSCGHGRLQTTDGNKEKVASEAPNEKQLQPKSHVTIRDDWRVLDTRDTRYRTPHDTRTNKRGIVGGSRYP